MSMNEAPYIFSAFSKVPTCAASEQSCDRINFFGGCSAYQSVCQSLCCSAKFFQLCLSHCSAAPGYFLQRPVYALYNGESLLQGGRKMTREYENCSCTADESTPELNKKQHLMQQIAECEFICIDINLFRIPIPMINALFPITTAMRNN